MQGYLTVRDAEGTVFAECGPFHICTASVAMTNDLDIRKGKIVRKLATGEVVEVIEGPTRDGDSSITRFKGEVLEVIAGPKEARVEPVCRVRCRAVGDGAEGWCTLRCGALRPGSRKYVAVRAAGLREAKEAEGAVAHAL